MLPRDISPEERNDIWEGQRLFQDFFIRPKPLSQRKLLPQFIRSNTLTGPNWHSIPYPHRRPWRIEECDSSETESGNVWAQSDHIEKNKKLRLWFLRVQRWLDEGQLKALADKLGAICILARWWFEETDQKESPKKSFLIVARLAIGCDTWGQYGWLYRRCWRSHNNSFKYWQRWDNKPIKSALISQQLD